MYRRGANQFDISIRTTDRAKDGAGSIYELSRLGINVSFSDEVAADLLESPGLAFTLRLRIIARFWTGSAIGR
jgi:hypothetical protein